MYEAQQPIQVYARWRPLEPVPEADGLINRTESQGENSRWKISIIDQGQSGRAKSWQSTASLTDIFNIHTDNEEIFKAVVAPALPRTLEGNTCGFLAYGHTGSGKTHTIIGRSPPEGTDSPGLYLLAATWLSEQLNKQTAEESTQGHEIGAVKLGLGVRLFELRQKRAYDLLDGGKECHVRQDGDGNVNIRGETEVLDGGKVRVKPIAQKLCWTPRDVRREVEQGLALRAVGTSTVHDQSSRTHAVLEIELVSSELAEAREALIDAQSELVPVGKRATDIKIEEFSQSHRQNEDGSWSEIPERPVNRERIATAEAAQAEYEARVAAAEQRVTEVMVEHQKSGIGGKVFFVDLAGAEYHTEGTGRSPLTLKQTPQEAKEGRQINTDLFALNEVIRAWAANKPRIPFRSSTLTMVLREYFVDSVSNLYAMILTLSPSSTQFSATMNSLKYGDLVGKAGRK